MAGMASSTFSPSFCFRSFAASEKTCCCSSSSPAAFKPLKLPLFWPWQKVSIYYPNWMEIQYNTLLCALNGVSFWLQVRMGPLSVSPMGFGTWAWGNQLLWGYQESMDAELQHIFNLAVKNGINLFDTADSYGTGRLNGQSEKLLGKFIRESQGPFCSLIYFFITHLYPRPGFFCYSFSRNNVNSPEKNEIVIATKFAAYPWRLTPGQFVKACK